MGSPTLCRNCNDATALLQGSTYRSLRYLSQADRSKTSKRRNGAAKRQRLRPNVAHTLPANSMASWPLDPSSGAPLCIRTACKNPSLPRPQSRSRDSECTATQRCSCESDRAGVRHDSNVSRIPANQVVPQRRDAARPC